MQSVDAWENIWIPPTSSWVIRASRFLKKQYSHVVSPANVQTQLHLRVQSRNIDGRSEGKDKRGSIDKRTGFKRLKFPIGDMPRCASPRTYFENFEAGFAPATRFGKLFNRACRRHNVKCGKKLKKNNAVCSSKQLKSLDVPAATAASSSMIPGTHRCSKASNHTNWNRWRRKR